MTASEPPVVRSPVPGRARDERAEKVVFGGEAAGGPRCADLGSWGDAPGAIIGHAASVSL